MESKEKKFISFQNLFSISIEALVIGFTYLGFFQIPVFILAALLFTRLYYIPLCYLLWVIYDRETYKYEGRASEWIRSWKSWFYFTNYFPMKIIKTSELSSAKNYMFIYHPHGILPIGFIGFTSDGLNFRNVFPGLNRYQLLQWSLFWVPILREFLLAVGSLSASRETIEYLLTKKGTGNVLILNVGSCDEAIEAHSGTATVYLKRRKGFVKLALKHGASLVPVFSFGENELFTQIKNPEGSLIRKFQNATLNTIGTTVPFFYGTLVEEFKLIGWLPYRRPMTIVVGKPIHLEKVSDPTEQEINDVHEQYIRELVKLFEEHKEDYGPNLKLKII